MNKKVNQLIKIADFNVSKTIFWFPILIFLITIISYISGVLSTNQLFILSLSILFFSFADFLIYIRKKIVITNKKLYIYDKFTKSKVSLDLVKNLKYFRINQTILGKILNYGNIELVDNNDLFYKIEKIENPNIFVHILVEQTNIYLKEIGITEEINAQNNVDLSKIYDIKEVEETNNNKNNNKE